MPPSPSQQAQLRKRKGGDHDGTATSKPSSNAPSTGLATYHELKQDPEFHFLADNEAIHTGYRHRLSPWGAFKSAFTLHNETINICTHGLGAILFVALFISFLLYELPSPVKSDVYGAAHGAAQAVGLGDIASGVGHMIEDTVAGVMKAERELEASMHNALNDAASLPRNSPVPTWPLGVFMISAVICLGLSATFHTFHIVSEKWFRLLSSLDYSGIAVLIWGSTLPMLELGFYCKRNVGHVYAAVGTLIALATCYVGVSPQFRTTAYRKVRMSCFIATGCYGAVPYFHLWLTGEPVYPEALPRLLLMGGLYIFGALLYGFRIPESLLPGRFDRWMQSHNIFHACVVAAALVHYRALMTHYAWRQANSVCPH